MSKELEKFRRSSAMIAHYFCVNAPVDDELMNAVFCGKNTKEE